MLENIKKNQTELKNIITEIKSTLEGINNRLDDTEEWISELEDRVVKISQAEQKKKKKKKKGLNKWGQGVAKIVVLEDSELTPLTGTPKLLIFTEKLFFKIYLFTYLLFLAALGLCCCWRDFL